MSIQARLAAEYVDKVRKLPESRAIDPATSKTRKDLKLKVVTCVGSKITPFLFQAAMMVWKLHSLLKIFLFLFQCTQSIPQGDETIYILSHYTRCKPDKMR